MPPKGNNTSSSIRKWSMKQEEIKKIAKELTKVPEIIEEVQAPAIEPVVHWDYEVIAAYIKAHCAVHETFTATSEDLLKMIPQNKRATSIAANFNIVHWLSYRKTEWENNNDTYVFFVEPTREELIVMLTSAETKVIELEKEMEELIVEKNKIVTENYELKNKHSKYVKESTQRDRAYNLDLKSTQQEKHDLQSDLYNIKYQRNRLLFLAILLFIYILISNYYG